LHRAPARRPGESRLKGAPSPPREERELKFAGVELSSLRERLVELEAERVSGSSFEDNFVLDRDGELAKSGCLLRLRIDGQGAHLTFKGPVRHDGRAKVRPEHEVQVEDAQGVRAIFESLGYRVARRYQKQREVWRLGGLTICLDRTPMGDFAEFEGTGGEKVARRCGLDPDAAERRSYLRLYEEFRKSDPEAPEDMVFP
jgi:adenylate cyclase, class 2